MTYTNTTYKGKYTPENPQKYRGDTSKIVYRSSYEVRFFRWCDINTNVLAWSSEEVIIPYINPFDHQPHRYFVDAWIKVQTKNGDTKEYLVEIKPERYQVEPKIPKKRTKQFLQEVVQWKVNQSKWKAARAFAKTRGWEFILVGETDLGLDTIPLSPFKNCS